MVKVDVDHKPLAQPSLAELRSTWMAEPELSGPLYLKGRKRSSVIHQAAVSGDLVEIVKAVERGEDLDEKDDHGNTALVYAVRKHEWKVAEMLLNEGADLTVANKFNQTILHETVYAEDVEAFQWLLGHGASVKMKDGVGQTLLHACAFVDNKALAKLAIERGCPIDTENGFDATALQLALQYHASPEFVQMLIAAGASLKSAAFTAGFSGNFTGAMSLLYYSSIYPSYDPRLQMLRGAEASNSVAKCKGAVTRAIEEFDSMAAETYVMNAASEEGVMQEVLLAAYGEGFRGKYYLHSHEERAARLCKEFMKDASKTLRKAERMIILLSAAAFRSPVISRLLEVAFFVCNNTSIKLLALKKCRLPEATFGNTGTPLDVEDVQEKYESGAGEILRAYLEGEYEPPPDAEPSEAGREISQGQPDNSRQGSRRKAVEEEVLTLPDAPPARQQVSKSQPVNIRSRITSQRSVGRAPSTGAASLKNQD